MKYIYEHAIVGGTFDHFHVGHKFLIREIFTKSAKVTIGIVENILSKNKLFPESIEDYATRLGNLKSFLQDLDVMSRTNIIKINDIYGTALTDGSIQAIFVTESTSANAKKINTEREKIGMPPLDIITLPYVLGDDDKIVSSYRIREGIIDRNGSSYLKFFKQKDKYQLPNNLRKELQQPIGVVVKEISDVEKIIPHDSYVISVGDIVSLGFKKNNFSVAISIIDYTNRRIKIDKKIIKEYFPIINRKIKNQAGSINKDIADMLCELLKSYMVTKESQTIAVTGEEDLLALPCILLLPLDSFVVYGQHDFGMVVVKISEETKNQVKEYLSKF